ncbi:MAG: efflux RND transporter periplasmic adaptor subunit, partial [Isosphaeraceae bacterium]
TGRTLAGLRGRLVAIVAIVAGLAATGCRREARIDFGAETGPQPVRLMYPDVRTIVRRVGQPSFIESFERTAVYPKMTAYIEKWIVDIGDKVKKGDVLATLFVPEIVEDHRTKQAAVALERERIALAREAVEVTKADLDAARSRLAESRALLGKYQAMVDRWAVQVRRLQAEVDKGDLDPKILDEATDQLRASTASLNEARAAVSRAEAEVAAREASLGQAVIQVKVVEAALAVAQSDERRLAAWVGYLTLTAPFDGVITVRNANTFDFVLPATGDPTAMYLSPDISNKGAAPIYVVDRTDVVRVFADIPEQDADYVKAGTPASVQVRAFGERPIAGKVTRTSWALNFKSRTLRAEIDLPNPGGELLPNMYAYVEISIERPGVRALPASALSYNGEAVYCWLYRDGKAVRTELQTGVSDGRWIEVTDRRISASAEETEDWKPIGGSERVILGDPSSLTEGTPVEVVSAKEGARIAADSPAPRIAPTHAVPRPAADPPGLRSPSRATGPAATKPGSLP